jgi:hypothetical protein
MYPKISDSPIYVKVSSDIPEIWVVPYHLPKSRSPSPVLLGRSSADEPPGAFLGVPLVGCHGDIK